MKKAISLSRTTIIKRRDDRIEKNSLKYKIMADEFELIGKNQRMRNAAPAYMFQTSNLT